MSHKNFDEKALRLTAKFWTSAFADMNFDLVFTAFQKWCMYEPFPPKISDLRQLSVKIQNPQALRTAEDAWEDVILAVKRFGYYQKDKAFETLDAGTKRCIKAIGWDEICHSDKIGVVKSNFVKMFDNIAETQKESDLVPLEIIERIQNFNALRGEQKNALTIESDYKHSRKLNPPNYE